MMYKKIAKKFRRILGNIKAAIIICVFNLKIAYKSKIEIVFIRKVLKKYNIINVQTLNVKAWHTDFYYFKGEFNKKNVYIKCSTDFRRIGHEEQIIRDLDSIGALSGLYPKLLQKIEYKKNCYLIEEYFGYKPLDIIVQENSLSDCDKESIFKQLVELLDVFYTNEFVHGDIRPENFFFDAGKLYIIDFGFSFFMNGKNKYFDYINKKKKAILLDSLNKEYRLENRYFDDAFSSLLVCKFIDASFFTKFHSAWEAVIERCERLTYQEVE